MAALYICAKLHHIPEGQQRNAIFSTIEAFGGFLHPLHVEPPLLDVIQTLSKEALPLQRS